MRELLFTLAGTAVICLAITPSFAQQITTFPYSTDFESEVQGPTTCGGAYTMLTTGWMNDTGDDIDWSSDLAGTGTGSTGPSADHTLGTVAGHYLYTEASSCFGQTANLLTPYLDFTALTNPTLSFWYHMYGIEMGDLFVEVGRGANPNWVTLGSWTDDVNLWQQDSVQLCQYAGQDSIRVRFRGVTGSNLRSDMALDDIMVYNGTSALPIFASVINAGSPDTTNCGSANLPVDITVYNNGCADASGVTLTYNIGGGDVTNTLPTIVAGDSIVYAIPGGVDFSAGGYYTVILYTSLMTDSVVFDSVFMFPASTMPTSVVGDTGCSPSAVTLTATGDSLVWYDSTGTQVGTGNSYTTPSLSTSGTYYVENIDLNMGKELATTYIAGSGASGGAMFDVIAMRDLTIDSFMVHPNAIGTQNVEVYYKTGTYLGAETNSGLWTLLGSDSVTATATVNDPQVANIGGLSIMAGDTMGIFVSLSTNYTFNNNTYTNNDMEISAGTGVLVPFTTISTNRTWNGTVYYNAVADCPSDQVAVEATIENCSGIANSLSGAVRVFPNPTNGDIINLEITAEGSYTVKLYNLQGQLLMTYYVANKNLKTVDVSGRADGIYYLRVEDNKGKASVHRVVVN